MKYITTLVLIGWSVYALTELPDLTGKENMSLYLLCLVTLICTIANMIMVLTDFDSKEEY